MRSVHLVVAVVCGASCLSAFAQTTPATSAPARAPQAVEAKKDSAATPRASLLGVDADGDGIRDDIEAIVAKNPQPATAESSAEPKEKAEIVAGMAQAKKPQTPRSGCFDYLMLAPKDRNEADLRTRQRSNSMPGTHPCDPIMSPLRERPYDTEYAQIGPVTIRK